MTPLRVKLYVGKPGKPDLNIVTEVEMPDFRIMPEIVVWGERFFYSPELHDGQWSYTEGFAYFVPPRP